MTPYYDEDGVTIYHGDCRDVLLELGDSSVSAVVTDPPYFKVLDEAWDKAWGSADEFLAWLGSAVDECARAMAPNASLYCFASPHMAGRVECMVRERLHVLNHIVWHKAGAPGRAGQTCKEALRSFWPSSERIIFAEQYGADNMAKGEAGYVAKCDELRGFVFEPLRSYLAGEMERAGWTVQTVNQAWRDQGRGTGGMAGHWMTTSQWTLPTARNYAWLRELFNADGGEYLRKDYEYLRKDYEELRKDYEELRRPFTVTAEVPHTDVWEFAPPPVGDGRHPCEKSVAMLMHIIGASTRPGDLVLDPFMGAGSTLVAASRMGRRAIGIELDEHWCEVAAKKLQQRELFGSDTTTSNL